MFFNRKRPVLTMLLCTSRKQTLNIDPECIMYRSRVALVVSVWATCVHADAPTVFRVVPTN